MIVPYILAVVISAGGSHYQSGVSVSQMKYDFDSKEACEQAAAYYSRTDVIKYHEQRGKEKLILIDAKCWKK